MVKDKNSRGFIPPSQEMFYRLFNREAEAIDNYIGDSNKTNRGLKDRFTLAFQPL
jgi:hypothetical protein